jgi:hypothetical protein
MAGLNEFVTDTAVTKDLMPSWFSKAQEALVTGAQGVTGVPISSTVIGSAQGAFGPTGPFASGQAMLESIGSGAANPWIVGPGNKVSPDVTTPMGGLFQAQTDYLNTILPDIQAAETAKYIGGGGFGSRMNLSGLERAKAAAAADLFQKQMASALQSQQTGAQAASGLGTLGSQLTKGALETGTFEQAYPYADLINLSNIYGRIAPALDRTKEQTKELSLLGQIGTLGSLVGGASSGIQDIATGLKNVFDFAKGYFPNEYSGNYPDPNVDPNYVYGTSEGE